MRFGWNANRISIEFSVVSMMNNWWFFLMGLTKDQKTPQKEIDKAKRLMKDYFNSKKQKS